MSEMRDWRKAVDSLNEGHPVWGQKYPDTAEGAKQFLNDISTWDVSNATAQPDPQVEGVWKVSGLVKKKKGPGLSFSDKKSPVTGNAIVYLAGYKKPLGGIRHYNDFEDDDMGEVVAEAVVEVPDGLRGEKDSHLSRHDAEKFINELRPEDTVDTNVVDPESGEILDWPDRATRQKQEDDELEAQQVDDVEDFDDTSLDTAPTYHAPKSYEQAWDVLGNLRSSDFYTVAWEELAEMVDNPEELRGLDYDVDMEVPILLKRKDGMKLDAEDHNNIRSIVKAVKMGSTMGNIGVHYVGVTDGGTVAHFTPSFM